MTGGAVVSPTNELSWKPAGCQRGVSHPPIRAQTHPRWGGSGQCWSGRNLELWPPRGGPGATPQVTLSLILLQPPSACPAPATRLGDFRSSRGAAACFQAKSSLPFVLLPATFSVISQRGSPAGAGGQESLGENTTVFPNTLPLSYSLPPWLLGKPKGTDKRMQDRPAVPTRPPWLRSA